MSNITVSIQTKAARERFVDALRRLVRDLNDDNFDNAVTKLPAHFQELIFDCCGDTHSVSKINELVDAVLQIPVISLTVATELSEEMIARLHDWVSTHSGEYLLDFSYDASLIGGALVTCEGRFVDMSVSHLMSDRISSDSIRTSIFASSDSKQS